MSNFRKQLFFFLTFNLLLVLGSAQNDINSPYSNYGVGNLSPRSNNVLGAMGGVGYALQSPYYINFKNPAAFAAFDSLSFIGDLSLSVINQQLKTNDLDLRGTFAQLDYLAIGLPVMRVWRTSVGIMPFSDVGFGIVDVRHVDSITYRYTGSGGLQQLYWGNAFKVAKGFNLGITLSYLYGTINSSNFAEYSSENTFNTLISNFRHLDGIVISGGAQYHANFKDKHYLSVGAVYENPVKVWSKENLIIFNYFNEYYSGMSLDTVKYLTGKDAVKTTARLPQTIGGGVAYGFKDKVIAAVDVTWQNWKRFSMSNNNDSLKNNIITALGVQYVPNPSSSKYYNKINFRLGTRFSTGYIIVKDKPISEFAVSFGLGFPIRTFTSRSSVNIMFEYSRLGTLNNNLILQNYYKLSFNFILHEKWYQRRKLE